ncbi:MAG: hypothetical protein DI626_03680 [Micavibrio aeruginosavorus]|uniref:Methyltransferase domain-containing protein n=1 Tax=Micavibrio aeruginosavorus TaxID=349221 RepID=A0A2W5BWU7_9BACT|nr:MAG: hypothetical protein DI626_03680 [Micavibrio aeruginosavorus]
MSFNFTQAEFDIWAPTYDEDAEGRTGWSAHLQVAETVAKYAPASPGHVIDLGTGTGLLLPHLKSQFQSAALTGIDLSENMLEQCRAKNLADTLVQYDLSKQQWPFPENSAQVVTSSGVLEFIRHEQPFVKNACALLQEGGIAVVTYQPPSPGKKGPIGASPSFSKPHYAMKDAFQACGMEVLEQSEFNAYRNYGVPVMYGLIAARKPGCV